MFDCLVRPSCIEGSVKLPPSKSQSIRALLFASLADGCSYLSQVLDSPDVSALAQACSAFGARFIRTDDVWTVQGMAGNLEMPEDVINVGNSGLALRFIGALAGLTSGYTVVTGDASIRGNRVVQPLITGLQQWGGFAECLRRNARAPLIVRGPLSGGKAQIDGQDSQPVSALLIVAALAEGSFLLEVDKPGELPFVDMTVEWLERLGVSVEREGYHQYYLRGGARFSAFDYSVPGDWSSAAFPLVAAVMGGSSLRLENIDSSSSQGDRHIVDLLEMTGARIDDRGDHLDVKSGGKLKGVEIDCGRCIDALPILAVLGTYAEGRTVIFNASITRRKESNRIAVMRSELAKMGAQISETEDGLCVEKSELHGAVVDSHGDHRVAMALTVAGLNAKGETRVRGIDCVSKTYPRFFEMLSKQGAWVQCIESK